MAKSSFPASDHVKHEPPGLPRRLYSLHGCQNERAKLRPGFVSRVWISFSSTS